MQTLMDLLGFFGRVSRCDLDCYFSFILLLDITYVGRVTGLELTFSTYVEYRGVSNNAKDQQSPEVGDGRG